LSAEPAASARLSRLEAGLWIGGAIGVIVFFWLLTPILLPFVLGAILAYLGDPIVDRLERLRLSRTAAVCVVFVGITAASLITMILLFPLLQQQVMTFVGRVPDYLRWAQETALPAIGISLPEGTRLDIGGIREMLSEHWKEAGGVAKEVLAHITRSGGALLTFAVNMLMVPVVTFYLLRDWDNLVAWIANIIPRHMLPKVSDIARETDEVLSAFLRGQLLVMLSLAVIYTLGLWIAGLELALLIGLTAGLVSFVPYLGFVVGFAAAAVAIVVQEQALLPLVWVALVFGIGQILESALLTPWLVGDRIGLHPVAVIFAVLAGGQLFGFVGVLLALPVAAAVAVLLRHAKRRWLSSPMYNGQDGLP
jgi:predicted PurR-regulated permease PerM